MTDSRIDELLGLTRHIALAVDALTAHVRSPPSFVKQELLVPPTVPVAMYPVLGTYQGAATPVYMTPALQKKPAESAVAIAHLKHMRGVYLAQHNTIDIEQLVQRFTEREMRELMPYLAAVYRDYGTDPVNTFGKLFEYVDYIVQMHTSPI